jgi:FKBP-type peptidyl-prolyl cis-trans isomerase (trigger factor)
MNVDIKKLPKSELEITSEIPFSDLEVHRERALKKLGANLNLPGFRKGHIPEKIAVEKIGESKLLAEMAEMALGNAYPKIIIDNKIDPITKPEVTITKIAMNNPLGFKMRISVMPEMKLPAYKEIASSVVEKTKGERVEVKDEDIQNVINQALDSKKNETGERPELTDDFVKTLGDFKDLKDFNEKVREGVQKEKEWRQKEKVRIQIMEGIISKSEIDMPGVIIESELEKMIAGFKGDITKMGLNVDEYLKNTGKTEEELRKEWRGEAEKKGKSQLILNKIAVDEKIYPKKEEVEKEAKHLLSHHPSINSGQAKIYVETVLTNEAVMKWLEDGAPESENKPIEKNKKEE